MQTYRITAFAQEVGVTAHTLRVWDKRGYLKARRTPTGQRFYTQDQLDRYLKGDTYGTTYSN